MAERGKHPGCVTRRAALGRMVLLTGAAAAGPALLAACAHGSERLREEAPAPAPAPEPTPAPAPAPAVDAKRLGRIRITSDCINCGACVPECPNDAITEGDDIYAVDADKCSLCVGLGSRAACAEVCPVDCCLPDPTKLASESEAYALAKRQDYGAKLPRLDELPPSLSIFRQE